MLAVPALDVGGPDRVFYELAKYFESQGVKTSVAVSKSSGCLLDRLPAGVQVFKLSRHRYPVAALSLAVRAARPDVVLSTLSMSLTAGIACRVFPSGTVHVPRVANQLSDAFAAIPGAQRLKHKVAKSLLGAILKESRAVICQSEDMVQDLKTSFGITRNVSAIGNPFDFDMRMPAPDFESVRGAPALLAVGRLSKQKGFDRLIGAMPMIAERRPGAHLTILGEGELRAELESQIRCLGLGDHVSLPGARHEVLSAMRAAALFISPSRFEGFPNVVLEAIACGVPVVATNCAGGTRDMIEHGRTGFLSANSDDPAVLASTVLNALEIDMLDIAARARKRAEQRFSTRVIGAEYLAALSAATGRPQRARAAAAV